MPGSVDDIINAFGEKLVTDIRASLRSKGVTFGGGEDSKLAAKTRFEVKATSAGFVFNLIMPEYSYWVNKGRDPGPVSKGGRDSISKWAKRKGIIGDFQAKNLQDRLALQSKSQHKRKVLKKLPFKEALTALTFLVARKVTVNGYKGNHFLDEVLNDGRVEQFRKDLSAAVKNQIKVEILK